MEIYENSTPKNNRPISGREGQREKRRKSGLELRKNERNQRVKCAYAICEMFAIIISHIIGPYYGMGVA